MVEFKLEDFAKAFALDIVEGFPLLGDLVCLAHIIYLLSKGRGEEAVLVAPNIAPLPPAFGNTIVYLAKGKPPF